MQVLFEIIEELSDEKVEFYTVKLGERDVYEFEDFENRDFPEHHHELQILYGVINEMKYRGAKRNYFKFEEKASAIPFVSDEIKDANKKDFGIRLYCIWVSEYKVVLLNGHIKTKKNPRECPNVCNYFNQSRRIGTILDKAISNEDVDITEPWSLHQITIDI